MIAWRRRIARTARRLHIAQRVQYIDGGMLDALVAGSRVVVTINSTLGLRALQLGKPVKVLGPAVYDLPGLTHAGVAGSGLSAMCVLRLLIPYV